MEKDNKKVVIGTIPLFGSLACPMFDSGVTHSIISSTYVKICEMKTVLLGQSMIVATPVGDSIICRKCIEGCPIVVGGRRLPASLVVFKMLGYDIFLGIDWLSKYGASIDY